MRNKIVYGCSPKKHGSYSWYIGIILYIVICMFIGNGEVKARVVGIVFDDSGSMLPRINLPTFGAQILISTLDGRDGKDRLFTMRLSEVLSKDNISMALPQNYHGISPDNVGWFLSRRDVTKEDLRTQRYQQRAISRIAKTWPNTINGRGTPYEPVEIMLEKLSRETKPGERAYLIIISDGKFTTVPDTATLQDSYRRYKNKLEGSLRVDFLLMSPRDNASVIKVVNEQKVRETLLKTFNGTENDGAYDVKDLRSLWEALKEIIAKVSATDRKELGDIVRPQGNILRLNTPLSISRIISIAAAPVTRPIPKIGNTNFTTAEDIVFNTKMRNGDRDWGDISAKFRGETRHMRFDPALPPGTYELEYDNPVAEDVFLLFETKATIELSVVDEQRKKAPVDKHGVVQLVKGKKYWLKAQVYDSFAKGRSSVNFTKLSSKAVFTSQLDSSGASHNLKLARSDSDSAAYGLVNTSKAGPVTAHATMRLPGFVTSTSLPLKLHIYDSHAELSISVAPIEQCPTCREGEMVTSIGINGKKQQIARVDIGYKGNIAGRVRAKIEGAPNWISITDTNGQEIGTDNIFKVQPGKSISLIIWNKGVGGGLENISENVQFMIVGQTSFPKETRSEKPISLRVKVPKAKLIFRGHSQDPSGNTQLRLTTEDIGTGAYAMDFALTNSLNQPTAENFTVSGENWLIDYKIEVNDYHIAVFPNSPWWCACGLWFFQGKQNIQLYYSDGIGVQATQAMAQYNFQPTLKATIIGCLKLLAVLLILIWLMIAALHWFATHRFPRNSILKVEDGSDFPRTYELRGRNWTFPRVIFWPILRSPPNERRAFEGVLLEATRDGADVIVKNSSSSLYIQRLGQTIEELTEFNIKLAKIKLVWDDELERQDGSGVEYTLLRDMNRS